MAIPSLNCLSAQFAMAYRKTSSERASAIEAIGVSASEKAVASSDLNSVPGLGKASIEKLREAGITSVSVLASTDEEKLKKLLNPISRKQVKEYLASIKN